MSESPDSPIAGAYLVSSMWWYSAAVLEPVRSLKRAGFPVCSTLIGTAPENLPDTGLGPRFSKEYSGPVLLTAKTEHDHLVEEFDRMGDVYSEFVRPFSTPIFVEALSIISRWLPRIWCSMPLRSGRELLLSAPRTGRRCEGIDLAAAWCARPGVRRDQRPGSLRVLPVGRGRSAASSSQFDLVYGCLAQSLSSRPPQRMPFCAACGRQRLLRDRSGADLVQQINAPLRNGPIPDGSVHTRTISIAVSSCRVRTHRLAKSSQFGWH